MKCKFNYKRNKGIDKMKIKNIITVALVALAPVCASAETFRWDGNVDITVDNLNATRYKFKSGNAENDTQTIITLDDVEDTLTFSGTIHGGPEGEADKQGLWTIVGTYFNVALSDANPGFFGGNSPEAQGIQLIPMFSAEGIVEGVPVEIDTKNNAIGEAIEFKRIGESINFGEAWLTREGSIFDIQFYSNTPLANPEPLENSCEEEVAIVEDALTSCFEELENSSSNGQALVQCTENLNQCNVNLTTLQTAFDELKNKPAVECPVVEESSCTEVEDALLILQDTLDKRDARIAKLEEKVRKLKNEYKKVSRHSSMFKGKFKHYKNECRRLYTKWRNSFSRR